MPRDVPPRANRARNLAFDGGRGIGVLMVTLHHAGYRDWVDGRIALDFFFTLSGFLITTILVNSIKRQRTIDFRRFYEKRVRRLLPAFASMLYVVTLYGLLVQRAAGVRAGFGALPYIVLYFGNWYGVAHGAPAMGEFSHTWSLSVEEQFYLLWPLVVLGTVVAWKRPRLLIAICLLGSAAALVSRVIVLEQTINTDSGLSRLFLSTDTNADHILMGCALGVILAGASQVGSGRIRRLAWVGVWPAVVYLVLVATLPQHLPAELAGVFLYPFLQTGTALASAMLICHLALTEGSVVARVMGVKPLAYLGQISYGFYLWHVPVFAVLREFMHPYVQWVGLVLAFTISLVIATLSFYYLELPIREGRGWNFGRFRPRLSWNWAAGAAVATALLCALPVGIALGRGYI